MPLGPVPYDDLASLVRAYVTTDEDSATAALIDRLRPVRGRGYMRRSELEAVCAWKSMRAIHLIRSNSPHIVRTRTGAAFAASDEKTRYEALTSLAGVSAPMASALLMLVDPGRYAVLDIRVWQMLHHMGAVTSNPGGQRFSFEHWERYLDVVRPHAKALRVGARDIGRALFDAHREYQQGTLY